MFALVTGGTGFIGGHLVTALVAREARVRVLTRSRERGEGLRRLGVEVVHGDLLQAHDLGRALAGVEAVFHLAAQIQPSEEGPAAYWRNNVEGTAKLLAACRGLPLGTFVHVSSVGVMGSLAELPADEGTRCAPDNVYGRTKYEAEELARHAFLEGLPVVIARPAWVYGPGDLRTLRLFTAIRRRRFLLVGSGQTWLHPVYVEDVVEGLLRCGTHPKAVGETYCLAGPEPVRLRQLTALIAELEEAPPPRLRVPPWPAWVGAAAVEGLFRLLKRRPPLYRRQLEFFLKDQLFSTAKAREELGFVPATSLREGLARTISWYRDHGLLA